MTTTMRAFAFFLLGLAFIMPLAQQPALADDTARITASRAVIDSLITRINALVENEPGEDEAATELNAIIDDLFDYDTIARFTAGRAWRGASDAQKARYKTAFRDVMIFSAIPSLETIVQVNYQHGKAVPKGDRMVVIEGLVDDPSGRITAAKINWRILTREGQQPRIFDIEVENISMLRTQQQEYEAVVNSNGGDFNALIDVIEARAEEIRAGAASGEAGN